MFEKSIVASDKWSWIKDLVRSEEQMEETGIVDLAIGLDNERVLMNETLSFIEKIKNDLVEASNAFNQMKSSPLGTIKIYGIARTQSDFMLFRNGFKMIFSAKSPGVISIRFNFISPSHFITKTTAPANSQAAAASTLMDEHIIEAQKGAFGDIEWCFQGKAVKISSIVKYHLSLFIKESAK